MRLQEGGPIAYTHLHFFAFSIAYSRIWTVNRMLHVGDCKNLLIHRKPFVTSHALARQQSSQLSQKSSPRDFRSAKDRCECFGVNHACSETRRRPSSRNNRATRQHARQFARQALKETKPHEQDVRTPSTLVRAFAYLIAYLTPKP